ncbi:MAG: 2-C-methyl-D-erythritol 2,4-cyclodiphosphate synthase [Oscillospiraceae bacterium]|nr:2-C-methyl-D-erythritol 2,4-cyclodiphosphate synthase [Oscillospiraceae bacterium]
MKFSADAIIACGGSSSRMGENKLLINIGSKPCLLRTCKAFEECDLIQNIIISAPLDLWETYKALLLSVKKPILFAKGGKTRQESVKNAVLLSNAEIIAIHDGARPLITPEIIENSLNSAYNFGSGVVCVAVKDTIRYSTETESYCPERSNLYSVQTPQSFNRLEYLKALETEREYTDDAQLFESAGHKIRIVEGSYKNLKLTTKEDITMANSFFQGLRIGHGYDVHKLVEGRRLILGGVEIPFEKGLLGHSDADVLTHALCDALLGALALGDIGKHFPDTDENYKDANSLELLARVMELVRQQGKTLQNCDITVLAQAPKLAPHIQKMRENLATAMNEDIEKISIKATTEEGLGFTGEGKGISAHAVCLLA